MVAGSAVFLAAIAATAAARPDLAASASASPTSTNTVVLCDDAKDPVMRARHKPTSCDTWTPDVAAAEAFKVTNLHWHRWGAAKATATGIERGHIADEVKIHATVTLSRLKPNDCGGYSYTRFREKTKFGSHVQKLPAVCELDLLPAG